MGSGLMRRCLSVSIACATLVSQVTFATPVRQAIAEAPGAQWTLITAGADGKSDLVEASADGSVLAFQSDATNLAAADTNGMTDVFTLSASGGIVCQSVSTIGEPAARGGFWPRLSADGGVIAFSSESTDLVGADADSWIDAFAKPVATGTAELLSVSSPSLGPSYATSVDGTGAAVALQSDDDNLYGADNDSVSNVFIRTRGATPITSPPHGGGATGSSFDLRLAANGLSGAYVSNMTNLANDTNGMSDIFVWQSPYSVIRVSNDAGGYSGNGASTWPRMSDVGVVAYTSSASNLVTGDTNAKRDVFVWSAGAGNARVSLAPGDVQANGDCDLLDISRDGQYVIFESTATNLGSGAGVYLRELNAAAPVYLCPSATWASLGQSGRFAAIATVNSMDGSDANGFEDVYRVTRDFAAPSSSASVESSYNALGGPVITATDASSTPTAYWRYGSGDVQSAVSPAVASVPTTAGTYTLTYWAQDSAGNVERPHTTSVTVGDIGAPESVASGLLPSYDGTASIGLTASDPAIVTGSSGVASIEWWTALEGGTISGASGTAVVRCAGSHTMYWRAYDNAGNVEVSQSASFTVNDISPPTVGTASVQPTYSDVAYVPFWFDDGSYGLGLSEFQYRIDSGSAETTALPEGSSGFGQVFVTGLGSHTVEARGKDLSGNWSGWASATFDVIDNTDPTTSLGTTSRGPGQSTLVPISGADPGYSPSGVASIHWKIDGGTEQSAIGSEATVTVAGDYGSHTLQFWAVDYAGIVGYANSNSIWVQDGIAPSITASVTSGVNPSRVDFSATDTVPGQSGTMVIRWSVDDGGPAQTAGTTASFEISDPGTHTVDYWAFDAAWNQSATQTVEVVVPDDGGGGGGGGDPLGIDYVVVAGGAEWSRSATMSVESSVTGAAQMRFGLYQSGLDFADWVPFSRYATVTIPAATPDGEWPIWAEYKDADGVTAREYDMVRVDRVAPVTTCNYGDMQYWPNPAEIVFAAEDPSSGPSGVADRWYRLDSSSAATVPVSGAIYVAGEGLHTLEWWTTDVAGNSEAHHSGQFRIGQAPPPPPPPPAAQATALGLSVSAGTVTYPSSVKVTGSLSAGGAAVPGKGVSVYGSYNNGASYAYLGEATFSEGAYVFYHAPKGKVYYYMAFAGDSGYLASQSASVLVKVRPKLSTPVASASSVYRNKSFVVKTYMRPLHTAGASKTVFKFYRYESRKWVFKRQLAGRNATYNSTTTKVSLTTSLSQRGTWRVYAYHPADTHEAYKTPGYKTIVVK